ncbi:hypothetical protein ES708_28417 [subsurface metagenome]
MQYSNNNLFNSLISDNIPKGLVVCEADADRTVYQTVALKEFVNQSILFVHSHNKQTLKDVVELLVEAKILVGTIADIDLLNDETNLKNMVESLAEKKISKRLLSTREKIDNSVQNQSDTEILMLIEKNIAAFLQQLQQGNHTLDGAKGALNRIRKEATKWAIKKYRGVDEFDQVNKLKANRLLGILKSKR